MKIKKIYLYDNKKQIWRLIPTDTKKLVIEERDIEKKQVYFSCIHSESGKKIFKNFQLDEKFWIGIETIYKDVIYFHKFVKPDMPQHKGIIAFNLSKQKVLWQNDDQNFLFVYDDKLYCYQQNFESRNYFILNYATGQIAKDIGCSVEKINELRKKAANSDDYSSYHFPQTFYPQKEPDDGVRNFLLKLRNQYVISGNIEFVALNNMILFNFHEAAEAGFLRNVFKAVDLSTGKYILEEVLISKTTSYVPDSFFVKDDLLFLLIEKTRLGVYRIPD